MYQTIIKSCGVLTDSWKILLDLLAEISTGNEQAPWSENDNSPRIPNMIFFWCPSLEPLSPRGTLLVASAASHSLSCHSIQLKIILCVQSDLGQPVSIMFAFTCCCTSQTHYLGSHIKHCTIILRWLRNVSPEKKKKGKKKACPQEGGTRWLSWRSAICTGVCHVHVINFSQPEKTAEASAITSQDEYTYLKRVNRSQFSSGHRWY